MTDRRLIEDWLRRLKWSLANVPSPEREDIVAEARAHIEERVASGSSIADVLAGFGPADAYARQFIDEMEIAAALGAQRSGDLLGVIGRRVHRSLTAALALLAVLALGLVAAASVVMAAIKLVDPVHAGLWIGPTQQFIGVIDDPSAAHEVLGLWLYPLAALSLLLVWLIGRLVLIRAVRTLRPDA